MTHKIIVFDSKQPLEIEVNINRCDFVVYSVFDMQSLTRIHSEA